MVSLQPTLGGQFIKKKPSYLAIVLSQTSAHANFGRKCFPPLFASLCVSTLIWETCVFKNGLKSHSVFLAGICRGRMFKVPSTKSVTLLCVNRCSINASVSCLFISVHSCITWYQKVSDVSIGEFYKYE